VSQISVAPFSVLRQSKLVDWNRPLALCIFNILLQCGFRAIPFSPDPVFVLGQFLSSSDKTGKRLARQLVIFNPLLQQPYGQCELVHQ